MRESLERFTASDRKALSLRKWLPEGKAKAAVLVVHGMIEHSGRYAELASRLTASGYAVWAPDHRGHGLTAQEDGCWGYFAAKDGFFRVVHDLLEVSAAMREEYPGLKLHLFGHSMGSFLARACISLRGGDYASCVLSGTAYRNIPTGLGAFLGSLACALLGPKKPAPLLAAIGFSGYNDAFKPNKTLVDWHTKDDADNEAFMNDPLCRFICSHEFYRDLSKGLIWIERRENMERIPKTLPIWLFAGDMDPVGEAKGAVTRLAGAYEELGVEEVELTVWPGGRHEMIHETNKEEVMDRVVAWLDRH